MAMPDPADHHPGCQAEETGQPPSLILEIRPGVDASSALLLVWEQCHLCTQVTAYDKRRVPWRRFHRQWRPELAVWIATWEHRHSLGDRVTTRS